MNVATLTTVLAFANIIGIPILVYLIYAVNRKETALTKSYTSNDLYTQYLEYKKERMKINAELRDYIKLLEVEASHTKSMTENRVFRLEVLKSILIENKDFTLKSKEHIGKDFIGRTAVILIIASNVSIYNNLIEYIEQLIELENRA